MILKDVLFISSALVLAAHFIVNREKKMLKARKLKRDRVRMLTVNKAMKILSKWTRPEGTASSIREAEIIAHCLADEVKKNKKEIKALQNALRYLRDECDISLGSSIEKML